MWYPSAFPAPPTVEPVSLENAQDHCNAPESDFEDALQRLIRAARAHAEEYCNTRFAERPIVAQCDSFSDLSRLSEGPLKSVTSIEYVDPDGTAHTLEETVYEPHKDGLEPSIGLKPDQVWPRIKPGSRITVTAVYGGSVPESVQHAMLLFIGDAFLNRENAKREDWTAFDALLCNHRRGV